MNILKKVVVLFPGSFKILHEGHISLIQKYLNHLDVKEVRVFIGAGIRNGINQKLSFEIAQELLSSFDNVHVEKSIFYSPILTCYEYIMKEAEPGIYALAGSEKENDYKRVKKFIKDFEEKYKKAKNVKLVEISVNTQPIIYKGRTDKYENTPISASILRRDVLNNDYENFKTNYHNTHDNDNIIRFLFDKIKPYVK
jgi:hypothetical protein